MSGQPFSLQVLFNVSLNMRVVTGAVLRAKLENMGNLGSILSACISTSIISLESL
jgi:hypothetical protein